MYYNEFQSVLATADLPILHNGPCIGHFPLEKERVVVQCRIVSQDKNVQHRGSSSAVINDLLSTKSVYVDMIQCTQYRGTSKMMFRSL